MFRESKLTYLSYGMTRFMREVKLIFDADYEDEEDSEVNQFKLNLAKSIIKVVERSKDSLLQFWTDWPTFVDQDEVQVNPEMLPVLNNFTALTHLDLAGFNLVIKNI